MTPYRIVNLEQGSSNWLKWRRGKITASMAATILGVSPWETPLQLYNKILSGDETPDNEAMKHGRETESEARGWLIDQLNTPYSPACMESALYPWMAASLDGWNQYAPKRLIEIKCPMKSYAAIANMADIPSYYFAQVQHQMAVSGCESMYFLTYSKLDQDGVILTINRDELFIEKLITAEEAFYRRLVAFDPPDPIDGRDIVEISDPEASYWVFSMRENKKEIEKLEKQNEELRDLIIKKANGKSVRIGDAKITKVIRKGNVDYSAIPELQGLDLDSYRKPNIVTWRFS